MKKPKILLLNTYTGGGAAIACYRLGQALEKSNCQVSYLTIGATFDAEHSEGLTGISKLKGRFNFYAERMYFWRKSASKEVRFSFSPANVGIDISKHPLVQEADILHLHWVNHGFLSPKNIAQLQRLGKPIVWTMHDMWPFTGGCHHSRTCQNYEKDCGSCMYMARPKVKDISYKVLQQKKNNYSKELTYVSPSNWLREKASTSPLVLPENNLNIPNCINIDEFAVKDSTEARIRLGLPLDKKLLLFAAVNISAHYKGWSYLSESLKQLYKENPGIADELELVILGDNKEDIELAPNYKKHALGYIRDTAKIIDVYNAVDAFVTPSLEENLPNTLMESMACGTACIGFQVGGIPEMIDHKKNGYLARYKDISDLANGIKWTFSGVAHLSALGKEARLKAVEHYAEAVVAKKYIKLYNKLLNK